MFQGLRSREFRSALGVLAGFLFGILAVWFVGQVLRVSLPPIAGVVILLVVWIAVSIAWEWVIVRRFRTGDGKIDFLG